MKFITCELDDLKIEDEASFRAIEHYAPFKELLRKSKYGFRVLPKESEGRWDRALFLNLTFWGNVDGDVLTSKTLPADVITHVAWHHVTRVGLQKRKLLGSADAMFFGESIASAYDVYLIGRLLGQTKRSSFLESQVTKMSEAASEAGLSAAKFGALLESIAQDPVGSFEDLRALLFDASTALTLAKNGEAALNVFAKFEGHRFASLLHHYELSSWALYARAYATKPIAKVPGIRAIDRELRKSPNSVAQLFEEWCLPLVNPRR